MPRHDANPDPYEVVSDFVDRAGSYTDEVYVAIDPGATGAIALLCNKSYTVIDIPVIKVPTRRTRKRSKLDQMLSGRKTRSSAGFTTKFNYPGIVKIFKLLRPVRDRIVVCLEKIPPSMGKGPKRRYAEIMINRAYSMWPLFIASKYYALEEVEPAIWKKVMRVTSKSGNKEPSRHKALALFPRANILRKEDHDRAEALLIGEYIRRKRNSVDK